MKPYVLSIRAIGSEFARRLWFQFSSVILIALALSIALLVWITSYSAWWWLLAAPLGIAASVGLAIAFVFGLLIRHVRPEQTPDQRRAINTFVDKLQFAAEITGTPKFIILFRVIRSIAAPSSEPYLQDILETKDLHKEFQAITRSFRSQ